MNKQNRPVKYIIVTGGVMSGIGKGITASSIGVVLKSYGLNVTSIKIDPYLNIDAGTMSPFEHGECYVLNDGGEVDLDLGNYERFLGITLTKEHNITTGKIYRKIIESERNGEYLGKTVQVTPHITDCISNWIKNVASTKILDAYSKNEIEPDICIIELGGTVGDIESMPFVESLRRMKFNMHENSMCFVHIGYLPIIKTSNEIKTKPMQHSMQTMRSLGIIPDILCVRCEKEVDNSTIDKLSIWTNTPKKNIIINTDVHNIYMVPVTFHSQRIMEKIGNQLDLKFKWNGSAIQKWNNMAMKYQLPLPKINVSIVGKYTRLHDSYTSLLHAINHAGLYINYRVVINWIESDDITNENYDLNCDACIIPGGFGIRGIEGMILASKIARNKKIPCLGICLGMHIMVIESCRHSGLTDSNSSEFNKNTENPVICLLPDQNGVMGGTMRLGSIGTSIDKNTLTNKVYFNSNKKMGNDTLSSDNIIYERHRHRYEFNDKYTEVIEKDGLHISGRSIGEGTPVDIVEIDENIHPFYIGCQFHPEFNTLPDKPHNLFVNLISSSIQD
jgi:CTP synthase